MDLVSSDGIESNPNVNFLSRHGIEKNPNVEFLISHGIEKSQLTLCIPDSVEIIRTSRDIRRHVERNEKSVHIYSGKYCDRNTPDGTRNNKRLIKSDWSKHIFYSNNEVKDGTRIKYMSKRLKEIHDSLEPLSES